jgi:prepilin-type N-terminal cleavage/methylation domain-containing protein
MDFQIINFTRPEGGDNTGSISPTDNTVKLFMWKSIPYGFTIIEVLIAMAIFSIGILSLVYLQGLALTHISHSGKFTEAGAFAQTRVETLLLLPFNQIENGEEVTESGYTVKTSILNRFDPDADGREDMITVRVIVTDPSGVERAWLDILKARDIN